VKIEQPGTLKCHFGSRFFSFSERIRENNRENMLLKLWPRNFFWK